MKTCSCCKKDFEIEFFAFKNKSLNKRNAMCNSCRQERQKISYYKHHETNLKRVKQYKKDNKEWFFNLKNTLKCCACGESEPSCLDFHHMDSSEKEFDISTKRESSRLKILEEINRCACLCANCHRKYHAGKLNAPLVKLDIT